MWIIAKNGFVSLVQHSEKPDHFRARARRREHLVETFNLLDDEVIDLGENAPDYRWHADILRTVAAESLLCALDNLDYSSHVKESVTGDDKVMYRAMMDCWTALYRLQKPPALADNDWWTDPADYYASYGDAVLDNWNETLGPEPDDDEPGEFRGQVRDLADRMLSGSADTAPVELTAKVWEQDRRGKCKVCEDDILVGDEYVDLPGGGNKVGARTSLRDHDAGPAHSECAESIDYEVDYDDIDGKR